MKTKPPKALPEWERLLSAQALFQKNFPELVLVGGTAVALHTQHRVSIDADHILPNLKKRFADVLRELEREAGWKTKRLEPPVLILGHFHGVRTGIRQLIRSSPLKTTMVRGLKIPTIDECLRIKAYLIVKRNTTRDFIDFFALYEHLGVKKSLSALQSLDSLYPQAEGNVSVRQQLAVQLAEPKPWDLSQMDLNHYKSLKKEYSDWNQLAKRAFAAAQQIIANCLLNP